VELLFKTTTQTLYNPIKNNNTPNEKIVNKHIQKSEHKPKPTHQILANFIAGTIVALLKTLLTIFSTIFRILTTLAG
jgi:hypothetical protein